jgi:hypothetical protein
MNGSMLPQYMTPTQMKSAETARSFVSCGVERASYCPVGVR